LASQDHKVGNWKQSVEDITNSAMAVAIDDVKNWRRREFFQAKSK
jgi:hypothetical protein